MTIRFPERGAAHVVAAPPPPPPDRRRRLRWIGGAVLAAGIAAAGVIYFRDVEHPATTVDEISQDAARRNRRQMGLLYGSTGTLTVDIEEALSRPGTQIAIVLTGCAAIAGLCFVLARRADEDEETWPDA